MDRPLISEVRSFIQTENLNVDADAFYGYCDNRNWCLKDGTPIQRWQSLLISCHRKGKFQSQRKAKAVITERAGAILHTDDHGIWSSIDEEHPDPADVALYGRAE